jgi:hypothetical protein
MKESQTFLENAERCAHLADMAPSQPAYRRFKRMEEAWRALALEQDWLDGEIPPSRNAVARITNATSYGRLFLQSIF